MQHADIIRSRALRRDALRCLTDAAGRLSDPLSDVEGVCAEMRIQLDKRLAQGVTTPTEDLATSARRVLEEKEGEHPQTVTSGIEKIDTALGGGFRPAEMVVIGARPSVGKSTSRGGRRQKSSLHFGGDADSSERRACAGGGFRRGDAAI